MLVSLSWLQKYVSVPSDTAKLVDDLTMAGLNVERVVESGFADANVIVGHVEEVSPHPDADRLRVCQVQIEPGGDARTIVCGAPNVAAGQSVLVALPGAKLPNGLKIRRSKIRGVTSDGMICSETELGLGSDSAGIMVLDGSAPVGTPIADVLGDIETVLEIEVTPNRPDQLCHVGIAREIAAIYGGEFDVPAGPATADSREVDVEIESPEDCSRYVGLRVSGVRVGPSPQWLESALNAVGLNSINNIVDVANYVMMELGQPLHAFDYKLVRDERIVVRRARTGESLVALDEQEYELDGDTLIIADGRGPVAIAGVIGGLDSAVGKGTTELLIESAHFTAPLVRKGRKALGLSTDASYRFERGVNRDGARRAAERAAQLIVEIAGGTIGAANDAYPRPLEPAAIRVRRAYTHRILGVHLSTREMADCLRRLQIEVTERDDDGVVISVPHHRLDLVEEIDLVEEVARVYGYERIGTGWTFRTTAPGSVDPMDRWVDDVVHHLTARGFTEIVTTSFTDGRELEDFGWAQDDPRLQPIALRNPLTSTHRYMRTSQIPGMLDVARHNMDHGVRELALCQVGKEFLAPKGTSELPEERRVVSILMTWPKGQRFWNNSNSATEFYDIKGEIERLAAQFRIGLDRLDAKFDASAGRFLYTRKGKRVVEGGIVPGAVSDRYEFDQPVYVATLDLEELYRSHSQRRMVKPASEYPSSKRDLSLVATAQVRYVDIEKLLVKLGGRLLESARVFDVYHDDNIGDGRTAYGVRLEFRSDEGTLTDAVVDEIIEKMLGRLKNELDVELRS